MPADASPWGPRITDDERLRRCLDPLHVNRTGISDLAFKNPAFSVDRCSLALLGDSLARRPQSVGVAEFMVSSADYLSLAVHDEPENGNAAHANVYHPPNVSNSNRKSRAVALIERCWHIEIDGTLRSAPLSKGE